MPRFEAVGGTSILYQFNVPYLVPQQQFRQRRDFRRHQPVVLERQLVLLPVSAAAGFRAAAIVAAFHAAAIPGAASACTVHAASVYSAGCAILGAASAAGSFAASVAVTQNGARVRWHEHRRGRVAQDVGLQNGGRHRGDAAGESRP